MESKKKRYTSIVLFKPHNNPKKVGVMIPFYRCEERVSEYRYNLPEAAQAGSGSWQGLRSGLLTASPLPSSHQLYPILGLGPWVTDPQSMGEEGPMAI